MVGLLFLFFLSPVFGVVFPVLDVNVVAKVPPMRFLKEERDELGCHMTPTSAAVAEGLGLTRSNTRMATGRRQREALQNVSQTRPYGFNRGQWTSVLCVTV